MKQTLRKTFALKALMLFAMLMGAFSNAWADEVTTTYTFTGKDWTATTSNGESADWTNGKSGAGFNNNGIQVTTNASGAYGTSPVSFSNVTKIVATYNTNTSKGSGTIVAKIGDNAAISQKWEYNSSASDGRSANFTSEWTYETPQTGYVTITCNTSVNSIYLCSVAITCQVNGGDTPTLAESDFALANAPVALSFDLFDNSDAQVVSYTTSSTGAVTISESEYIETSVNAENNTITVTPKKKTPSTQAITVSQTKDETYSAGSATFTVTIDDSTPKTGGWQKANLSDLAEGDVFVIVGDNGDTYAMTNDNGTGSAPAAVAVTIANEEITSDVDDNIQWNISGNANEGYTFYPNGSTESWLYCTNTNNGIRVGTNTSNTFIVADGYLYHNGTSRYVGIYNSQDWRCYLTNGGNIESQTFSFYKYSDNATVKAPVITVAETFIGSTSATITCSTNDATIYYSFDNENWSVYTEALTITATTTIYAKAKKGNDESKVVSKRTTKEIPTPTVAIDATGITNTNVFDGTAAGTLTASVTYNDVAIEGATITWSGNNDEVATIDAETGAVTLVGAGSVTFTASFAGVENEYNSASDTYKMTVTNSDPNASGTKNNPYTVAQARNAIDAGTGITGVYAKGIVSKIVTAYNSQYGNISYNISEDGTEESDQLQAYRGFGIGGAWFTSKDDIQVGDEVVIYGNLKKYNSTYEFDAGNQLVSLSRAEKKDPELSFGETTSFTVAPKTVFTAPTLNNPHNLTVTFSSNNEGVVSVDETTGAVTIGESEGTAVITATFNGNDEYKAGSVSYTINVVDSREPADIAFGEIPETILLNEKATYAATSSVDNAVITYKSSDETIVKVDETTGEIEALSVGEAIITATIAETDQFKSNSASYTIIVVAPVVEKEHPFGFVYYEAFSGTSGSGGRDGVFTGNVGNKGLVYDEGNCKTDKFGGAYGCTKFGTTNDNGVLTTPSIALTGNGTLTFSAAGWGDAKTNTLKVTASGAQLDGDIDITLENGEWTDYTVNITEATGDVKLTFTGKRGFLDDIAVAPEEVPATYTRDVKIGKFGTICLPYSASVEGAELYIIEGKVVEGGETTAIVLAEEATLEAGIPYIFKGTADKLVATIISNVFVAADNYNGLYGTYAKQSVEEGSYLISNINENSEIVKAGTGCFSGINRAYINLDEVSPTAKSESAVKLAISDTATGINLVKVQEAGEAYDLTGRRVNAVKGGLYIVNGKKVVK